MNGSETKEKVKSKENGSKKKRIFTIVILIVVLIIILTIVSLRTKFVTSSGDTKEQHSSLDVENNGVNEFSVITYASSNSGKQEFVINKTDEYGNPLQGVSFVVAGYFETSYTIEYYKDSKIASDYTETIYGSILDERYFSTDKNGEISFTLLYGDYGIEELDTVNGYKLDDTIYWIRVNESGISFINESDVSWDYSLDGTFTVDTSSIKNTINSISGYELDYIALNSKTLGNTTSSLPTTVSDGDVLKIYLVKEPEGSYSMYFYEYPFGNFSSSVEILDVTYAYKLSEIFDIDGNTCLYIDVDYIDDILLDAGYKDYICFIYSSSLLNDLMSLMSVDCGGISYDISSILDGNEEILLYYSNIFWMVGDTKNVGVNTDYMLTGDDLYIFVTKEIYCYTVNFVLDGQVIPEWSYTENVSSSKVTKSSGKYYCEIDFDKIHNTLINDYLTTVLLYNYLLGYNPNDIYAFAWFAFDGLGLNDLMEDYVGNLFIWDANGSDWVEKAILYIGCYTGEQYAHRIINQDGADDLYIYEDKVVNYSNIYVYIVTSYV